MVDSRLATCEPNADVAGPGIIISFVTLAVLTVIASFICGCLKVISARSTQPTALNRRDTQIFTSRSMYHRVKYILKERSKSSFTAGSTNGLWHCVLSQLLIGLGLNQLVAGYALYIATMIKYGAYSLDPHASLGFRLSALSMFSQLQVPFVLQRSVKGTVTFRAVLLYIYVLLIFITTAVGYRETQDRLGLVAGMVAIYGATYSFLVEFSNRPFQKLEDYCNKIIEKLQAKFQSRKRFIWIPGVTDIYLFLLFRKHIAGKPLVQFIFGFTICASLSLYFLVQALLAKFGDSVEGCDLNIAAENEWTLSQIYAILMVVALLLPATDAYLEMIENGEEVKAGNDPSSDAQAEVYDEGINLMSIQSGRGL